MTLTQLLADVPALDSIRTLWLVFPTTMKPSLESAQEGNAKHRAAPVTLIDGRLALCADLLSEIHDGGLFAAPFSHLDSDNFHFVEVIDSDSMTTLFPQSET